MNVTEEKELLSNIVGMTEETGRGLCEVYGYATRVTRKDGNPYIITHDLRFDRINLQIENGLIVKADIG